MGYTYFPNLLFVYQGGKPAAVGPSHVFSCTPQTQVVPVENNVFKTLISRDLLICHDDGVVLPGPRAWQRGKDLTPEEAVECQRN